VSAPKFPDHHDNASLANDPKNCWLNENPIQLAHPTDAPEAPEMIPLNGIAPDPPEIEPPATGTIFFLDHACHYAETEQPTAKATAP